MGIDEWTPEIRAAGFTTGDVGDAPTRTPRPDPARPGKRKHHGRRPAMNASPAGQWTVRSSHFCRCNAPFMPGASDQTMKTRARPNIVALMGRVKNTVQSCLEFAMDVRK